MDMKYKLGENSISIGGIRLYQIVSLKDFGGVKVGDVGGWVESENNLSQEGECWVKNDACVYNSGRVSDNALVYDNAKVCENARVFGSAFVTEREKAFLNVSVYGIKENTIWEWI
jgi:hypothetical protein